MKINGLAIALAISLMPVGGAVNAAEDAPAATTTQAGPDASTPPAETQASPDASTPQAAPEAAPEAAPGAAPETAPNRSGAAAQVPDFEPVQVQLTPELVKRYLDSFPELAALGRELNRKDPSAETSDMETGLAYLLITHLNNPEAVKQINEVLSKYNFASYSDWANVAESVSIAADAASNDTPEESLEQQRKDAEAEIRNDSSMSDSDKQAAIEELQSEYAALTTFQPLPGNPDVVKPFLDRINELGAGN